MVQLTFTVHLQSAYTMYADRKCQKLGLSQRMHTVNSMFSAHPTVLRM